MQMDSNMSALQSIAAQNYQARHERYVEKVFMCFKIGGIIAISIICMFVAAFIWGAITEKNMICWSLVTAFFYAVVIKLMVSNATYHGLDKKRVRDDLHDRIASPLQVE